VVLVSLAAGAVGIVVATGTGAERAASASDNGLSRTPAAGWTSWSFLRYDPTDAGIRAQAAALRSSGLAAHGYVYVNLDDFYLSCDAGGAVVDSYGRWVPDPAKFPNGIGAVARYVHSLGLKFGVYVTPGIPQNAVTRNTRVLGTPWHARDIADTTRTEKNYNCQHMYALDYSKPGSQRYVNSFADLFASWGADYLKIDGVGPDDVADVQAWSTALRHTGRPINLALSNQLAIGSAPTWRVAANSWRTGDDIECYCGTGPRGTGFPLTDWPRIALRFDSAARWGQYAGRGGWNDLDAIEVGDGDQVGLTADQRRSQLTLWAMAGAPLLLGTDLTALDPTDVTMLTNDRMLRVDRDGLGAARIVRSGDVQVFAKRETDGGYAVALFNVGTTATATGSVTWPQVGFAGAGQVTDLWSGADLGSMSDGYSVDLRPGESRLIRVVPATPSTWVEGEAPGNILAGAARAADCAACSDGALAGNIGNGPTNFLVVTGLHAATAGEHTVTISYLLDGNRTFAMSVNGGPDVQLPLTGTSWSVPTTTTVTVTLRAGDNTIRFHNDTDFTPDVDKVSVD
jgi:hypothetical protein